MTENLKITRYRNGDAIPNVTDGLQWSGLSSGAYCNLYNDTGYSTTYGRLYNWFTVSDSRKIAPVGWHVPTNEDWQLLINYLGGESVAGGKLKETGTAHWLSPNTGATNEVAFTAISGGQRIINDEHPFVGFGSDGVWWSIEESEPTVAWGINIRSYETDARLMNFRLIMDLQSDVLKIRRVLPKH